jgi:acetyl-CoA acyltransferase
LDDFTFPALFAQRTKAYFEKFPQYKLEDMAHFSVKAYSNANKNPLAHMQAVKMDFETASKASNKNPNFLSNKELNPYLRTSDCSQVSDGASAIIIVSEEGLKQLGRSVKDTIEVLSVQHSTGNLWEDGDLTQLETTKAAADRAYHQAKIQPDQIQVAEVHDCFTMAELQMYEALGFAPYGRGIDLVKGGHTAIDGRIPVNTGGGLVGFGHPVGATGVKQVLEVYRQMKGLCGEYQVPKTPQYGLTANMGGSDKTAVVGIFQNHTGSKL